MVIETLCSAANSTKSTALGKRTGSMSLEVDRVATIDACRVTLYEGDEPPCRSRVSRSSSIATAQRDGMGAMLSAVLSRRTRVEDPEHRRRKSDGSFGCRDK